MLEHAPGSHQHSGHVSPSPQSPTLCSMAQGRPSQPPLLPVQPEAVRGVEQILGDVAPCDVCQDVPRHHLHLWGVAPHATGAGEAGALHGARASDGLMDDAGQGRG